MLVIRCRGIASRMATGSTSRSTTLVQPQYRPTIAHPEPAMWNMGITARLTLSAVNRHSWAMVETKLKKLLFFSITPLGRPVVPDV